MSQPEQPEYFVEPVPPTYNPRIPHTFVRYKVEGFPEIPLGVQLDTLNQFSFREFDTDPFSKIAAKGSSANVNYDHYVVEHETKVN